MKLKFCGAAQNVTGSKHLLEINGKKILLDCGLFQGRRKESEERNKSFPFDVKEIDAVVLSHAHIDHTGALPYLVKLGFEGPIYCTHATRDLCSILLRDSAHIHEKDAQYLKEKKGIKDAEPLYTMQDAEKALSLFRSVNYLQWFSVAPRVKVKFHDAGHLLGSAMEEWEIYDEDTKQITRFGFSGDIGRKNLPILKDPGQLENLDSLIMESTYGSRLHDEIADVEDHVAETINRAAKRGGKIIIPAFSVGRTQEIIYVIKDLVSKKKIDPITVYVDSPLSRKATDIFRLHPECFDDDLQDLIFEGHDPFCMDCDVRFTESVEDSKALNQVEGPMVIISASGMCEFGRIRHHLANNVSNPKNMLLIVGFMAENTLGRKLIDGENPVNILGDSYNVGMEVVIYNAFSGHADQNGLLSFAKNTGSPKNIFLVHGENKSQETLKEKLQEQPELKNTEINIPYETETYVMLKDKSWQKI